MSAPTNSRPLKHTLWSTSMLGMMDHVLRSLSVFIVSPLLIGGLGQENYGLWVLLVAWVGLLEMLDLGMSNTAARYFSSSVSRQCADETASLIDFFRKHYRRMGWGVCSLAAVGSIILQLAWPAARQNNAALMFLVLGLAQGFVIRSRIYPALLKGHLHYQTIILAGSTRVVGFAAGLIWLTASGITLNRIMVLHVSLLIGEQMVFYIRGRRLIPQIQPLVMEHSKKREIMGFAGKNVAATVAQLLRERIDTQILAVFLSLPAVTQYAVGVRLPNLAMDISNSLFGSHLVAGFTAAAGRKSSEELTDDLLKVLRLSAWAGLTGCLLLFVLGPSFIIRWLGTDLKPAGEVLRVLVPGIALTVMQYPAYSLLPALNKHGRLVLQYLATSVINMVVSVILVQRIGLTGVVWGTMVELVLQGVVGMPLLIAGALPVSAGKYLWHAVFRPLLVYGVLLAPASLWWLEIYHPRTYMEIGLGACGLGAVYLMTGFLLILNRPDRRFIFGRLRATVGFGNASE